VSASREHPHGAAMRAFTWLQHCALQPCALCARVCARALGVHLWGRNEVSQ
jgi:hypothetical protein